MKDCCWNESELMQINEEWMVINNEWTEDKLMAANEMRMKLGQIEQTENETSAMNNNEVEWISKKGMKRWANIKLMNERLIKAWMNEAEINK